MNKIIKIALKIIMLIIALLFSAYSALYAFIQIKCPPMQCAAENCPASLCGGISDYPGISIRILLSIILWTIIIWFYRKKDKAQNINTDISIDKKILRKKWLKIVFSVLLIIILVGLGYFYHNKNVKKELYGAIHSEYISMYHAPELLSVDFNKGITIEQAIGIAKKYGGEIWHINSSNSAEIKFAGADDKKLLELVEKLKADKDIEFVIPVFISFPAG